MYKRGASVSFFLVLAVLIVIAGGLIVWVKSASKLDITRDDYAAYDGSDVKGFVSNCLFKSTIAGLRLLGSQGGVIYQSQGGTTPDSGKDRGAIPYNGRDIFKGILAGDIDPPRSCVPTHPATVYNSERCPNVAFPFKNTLSAEISMEQLATSPPPAVFVRLFNTINLRDIYPRTENFLKMDATFNNVVISARDQSVYATLKSFIQQNISSCLDFSGFGNVEVIKGGMPEVTPIISADFVSVNLKLPLTINYQSKTIKMESFSADTRIRFKPVFQFAKFLLENEALDFSFDIGTGISGYDGITHKVLKEVVGKADLLEITDNKSFLPVGGGFVPYVFHSFIENSPPAISYIHYPNLDIVSGLRARIASCSLLDARGNPWEETSTELKAEIGTRMTKTAIRCIWKAYQASMGPIYREVYDPEDDSLSWDFKTANCNWGEPFCEYKGANLYFNNYLTIKFSDGEFEDIFNIPLKLYNHPVSDMKVVRVKYEEDILDDLPLPPLGVTVEEMRQIALSALPVIYNVTARDEDIYWGEDVDNLSLTVDITPLSRESIDLGEEETRWVLGFDRAETGRDANFSVRDKWGSSASKSKVIGAD